MNQKRDDLSKMLEAMPNEIREAFIKAVDESPTEEDFIAEMFVGDCPSCGSDNTKDCDIMEGIEDPTVGICNDCGYLWCSECGRAVTDGTPCSHWEVCENCEDADEYGWCETDALDCPKIRQMPANQE